ncbi:flagellar hook-basal body complex protein [Altererythrobacter sp. Z27]|uniref:flagellar hook-basal body complex protein n=1 Tax=Altererythrobacter sp. Z27 TaxID=3461147 RepID=UPI004043F24A
MFGAIYVGLSGLGAYSKGLQAVSNNVSNLNTLGFKSNNVTFSNLFSPKNINGLAYGNNSSSIGHGVTMKDLTINFGQGEFRQTSRDLDLSIDGNGFFVLIDGDRQIYTRTGSFVVNDEGFVVLQGTDYRLAVLDSDGRPVALNVDGFRTDAPEPTTRITFADNLSSTATSFTIPDIKVYGANGEEFTWSAAFTRSATEPNVWAVTVKDAAGRTIGVQTLRFQGGQVVTGAGELIFDDTSNGLRITFDFSSNVTSFSSGTVSSLRVRENDGHATGSLASLIVNENGRLEINYTNGEKLELGAVAIADFRDPQSLEQRSNALFAYSGFGQRQFLAASDPRAGSILSRRLEASNVDLGGQFGDLILIQRGFQASSQIISVSNDMIQQLFGIRGQ